MPRRGSDRLPDFIAPQLATLVQRPPEGDAWLHEIKIDGYRCMRGWTEARSGSGTQLAEAAKASGVDALEL